MPDKTYTTEGQVSGSCGHTHRTIEAAAACALRGRNDRTVVRADGSALTWQECRYIDHLLA